MLHALILVPAVLALAVPPLVHSDGESAPAEEGAELEASEEEEPGPWTWAGGFRPDVNVYGNFLGRKERGALFDEDGVDYSDAARLRQVDLILGTRIADGVSALLAAGVQSDLANTEYELEFEQAYLRFRELPLLGELPEGSSVVVGQFRTSFGRLNRERLYDLPQINRPRALVAFFGENGYAELGASASFRLLGREEGGLQLTAEYLDSGSPPLTLEDGAATGGQLLRLAWEPTDEVRNGLELGASWLHSRRADRESNRATVLGLDLLYTRRPGPGEAPSWLLGGEWLAGEIEPLVGAAEEPGSYYAWTQVRLDDEWHVGARYDVYEELTDDSLATRTAGVYVGYATSPHLRFALGIDRSDSDVALLDDVTRVFAELNFAAGTNPDRPFWR